MPSIRYCSKHHTMSRKEAKKQYEVVFGISFEKAKAMHEADKLQSQTLPTLKECKELLEELG